MKTQKFRFGTARRMMGLVLASFAVASLAQDPAVIAPNEFKAPKISNLPLSIGAVLPDNIMLLLNTGSFFHYGYLPSHADRYDLNTRAYGYAHVTSLNKPFHSSHVNKIYYNPAIEYKKPLGCRNGSMPTASNPCAIFPDANFYDAPLDGFGIMSQVRANLYDNFHATNFQPRLEDNTQRPATNLYSPGGYAAITSGKPWVRPPEYKTDTILGPSTGITIGSRAHYNLYHPGRVKVNAQGKTVLNTMNSERILPAQWNGAPVHTQKIINRRGEPELTYGTAENPVRMGCEFQDRPDANGNRVDYYNYGKYGGNGEHIFPIDYPSRSVGNIGSSGWAHSYTSRPSEISTIMNNPQHQFASKSSYYNINWMLKYYNCFEAIRVGEAEDKDEYYTWWKNSEKGRQGIAITAADKRQNFANWYSYYYHPGSMMKTVLSHTLDDLDPETRIGYAVSGCDSNCGSNTPQGGGANVSIDGSPTLNYVKRGVRPYRDFKPTDADYPGGCPNGACKTQLRKWLFDLTDYRGPSGTGSNTSDFAGDSSVRQSLKAIGEYYRNTTRQGPWSSTPGYERTTGSGTLTRYQSCRRSYAVVMVGGSLDDSASGLDVGHADAMAGDVYTHPTKGTKLGYQVSQPFADRYPNTLADVAMHYWKNDLFPGAGGDNRVPTSSNDPAFWQHMNVVVVHTDSGAYSVDVERLLAAMEEYKSNPKNALNVLGNSWGYPGPEYVSRCPSAHGSCPSPPLSGWGNPNAGSDDDRREEEPLNRLSGDELIHAALNSRGAYASSVNPTEISNLIKQGLTFVRRDNTISESTVATNAGSPNAPMLYQAAFNDSWNGKLLGYRICTSADVARDYSRNHTTNQSTLLQNDSRCREDGALWYKASWDAGKILQTQIPGGRSIFTWDPAANTGVRFLDATLSADLNTALCGASACAAEVAYLSGDGAKEKRMGGVWRSRVNEFMTDETVGPSPAAKADGAPRVLGDIVNSGVLFVGRDDYGWAGFGGITYKMRQDYRWRKANAPRTEVLYVGANDGMLHAFNASAGTANGGTLVPGGNGGKEVFAYVPHSIWRKLNTLLKTDYVHEFYVDGSPIVGDAYLERASSTKGWNTVLIGSVGMGGSGYFALDVEKPDTFGANNVLWDIHGPDVKIDMDGAASTKRISPAVPYTPGFDDLGYTIGQAAVIALRKADDDTLKWVAIFPNGYNSYLDRPMLYIVDLKTGTIQTSLKDNLGLVNHTKDDSNGNTEGSPTDPNGLSTPIAADLNNDGLVDVIYAGDLRGNLWRFRLNGTGAIHTEKIFEARDAANKIQPITARPEVGRDNTGHVMVYFGTGQFIAKKDIANKNLQSFYGVRDVCALGGAGCAGGGTLRRGNLLAQQITLQEERAYATQGKRYGKEVRLITDNAMTSGQSGFVIDLARPGAVASEKGERVIHTPILWRDRVIFNTIVPNDDECEPGGAGWMYEVDPNDGSRLEFTVFDLDHDGKFGDRNDLFSNGSIVSGVKIGMGGGLTAHGDTKYHSNNQGNVTSIRNNKPPHSGRRYWRQVR
ncbi:MAG: hypothetical protein LBF93_07930 [Zoogloeaceae bacterium]|nr:hypothetical protein [Zoogloeaceae bacterium]